TVTGNYLTGFTITFVQALGSVVGSADWSGLVGTDGFFVLNTMGGACAPQPGATTWTMPNGKSDDDWVDASLSTLPLIIFGGPGNDVIAGGKGNDIIVGDFGRVQTTDQNGKIVATYGYGGRGDLISSLRIAAQYIYSTVPGPDVLKTNPSAPSVGGNDILMGIAGDDILIGGANNDMIDGGTGDDLIFGDNVQLKNEFSWSGPITQSFDVSNPRFRTLTGTAIYTDGAFTDTVNVNSDGHTTNGDSIVGLPFRSDGGTYLPAWATWNVKFLDQAAGIDPSRAGNDYIAGGANDDQIFGQGGNDVIQGDGSINLALGQLNGDGVPVFGTHPSSVDVSKGTVPGGVWVTA